jgi:hypothetical protein
VPDKYRVLIGMNVGADGRRYEPGQYATDIPTADVANLKELGAIELVRHIDNSPDNGPANDQEA